jgi:tetratricopeptide (TPR) repeat protein/DNA polymerase III epsilon subunit-like protein
MKNTKEIAIDFLKNNQFKEGISLLSVAIESSKNDSSLYFYRAEANYALNKIPFAINDINRAIEINSKSALYFKTRGGYYFDLKNWEDAIKDFSQSLEIKSDDHDCRWMRSYSFAAINDLNNSLHDAEILCSLNSKKNEYFGQKGYCLLQLGKFSDSIKAYEEAIKLCDTKIEYFNDLGFAMINNYIETGDPSLLDSAIKAFDSALKIDNLFADSFYRRGWTKYLLAVYYINNDFAFEFVPHILPDNSTSGNNLGIHIVDNLEPLLKSALIDLFRSLDLYELNRKPYSYYRIAQCFSLDNKKANALKFINEALKLQSTNDDFLKFKNNLLAKINNPLTNEGFPKCKNCESLDDVQDFSGPLWWCKTCGHSINYLGNCVSDDCTICDSNDFEGNNFPRCKACGDANDVSDPGGSYWWCSHCEHSIDQDGDCVSDECETCAKENESVDISESIDNEIDFPECKTCGDANDVSDPGGSYWWCSHCEHSIDQDGNCVSDECETCEKDPFIAMSGPFYLFFDTETTGVPRDWKAPITKFDNWPRIVQLAWLIYDSNGTQILKNEFIIKPSDFEIPIEASNVHGITTEYALEHGTPIEDVLLKFEKHCEKSKYLIAHNINFDSKVTSSEYLRILSRNPISKLEKMCTMESSTNYCKIPGNYGYKWPKLSELHVKLFGVDFEGAHDALADIEATAKCFWEMRKLKLI